MYLPYIDDTMIWRDTDRSLDIWFDGLIDDTDRAEFANIVDGFFTKQRVIPRHFKRAATFIPWQAGPPRASWHEA
jgi:hypothetical protein